MAAKKLPGRNVKESERHTVAVKLRLPPEVAESLERIAEDEGRSKSAVVEDLIRAARGALIAKTLRRR